MRPAPWLGITAAHWCICSDTSGIPLFILDSVTVTRYRYRGNKIPVSWTLHHHARPAGTVESPVR